MNSSISTFEPSLLEAIDQLLMLAVPRISGLEVIGVDGHLVLR
jgi:hypothetical protein